MIYPSIDEITKNQYNRYTLCIAVAKCARIITDEYVRQRENAERMLANKETDKTLASLIKREYRDEKAVKNAIQMLYTGQYRVVPAQKAEHESSVYATKDDSHVITGENMEEDPTDFLDEKVEQSEKAE